MLFLEKGTPPRKEADSCHSIIAYPTGKVVSQGKKLWGKWSIFSWFRKREPFPVFAGKRRTFEVYPTGGDHNLRRPEDNVFLQKVSLKRLFSCIQKVSFHAFMQQRSSNESSDEE